MATEHLPMELKFNVREYILTTHFLKKLQDEQQEFQGNISPSMKELVRSKIFTQVYHKSTLAWYMKTNLYKEWLETNHTNEQLKNSSMSMIQFQITPVQQKLDYIIRQLSRDTIMDYREPDTKIVK